MSETFPPKILGLKRIMRRDASPRWGKCRGCPSEKNPTWGKCAICSKRAQRHYYPESGMMFHEECPR